MHKETLVSDFEGFLDYVRDNIKDYVGGIEDCRVQIIPMVKNNQVIMEGLQIANLSDDHAPVIYLEGFYEAFCMGMDLDEIMMTIAHVYEESKTMKGYLEPDKILDFKEMKDRIILRLVNGEKNRDILTRCPHRFITDLAVTYRVLAGKNEDGISTFLVSNGLMEKWNINEQQLYELACENTRYLFPPVVEKLRDMMKNSFGIELSHVLESVEEEEDFELYILTNDMKINGASAMIYSNALEWLSKKINSDFYIIPSSIHELLLLSMDTYITPKKLQSMIRDVNQHIVLEEEILSDNLYIFSRKDKKIRKYDQS